MEGYAIHTIKKIIIMKVLQFFCILYVSILGAVHKGKKYQQHTRVNPCSNMTPIISTFYKGRRDLLIGTGLLCNMLVTFFIAIDDWLRNVSSIHPCHSPSLFDVVGPTKGERVVQFIAGRTSANVRLTM